MTDTNQLQRIETAPAQLQAPAPVNFAEAVQAIIAAGVTADSAAAVQSLLASHHQEEERWARRTFLQAFKRVRDKTKTIQAEKAVPGSNGTVRWWYATLEDLQDAIEPICEAEGLMLNFDTPRSGDIVKGVCIVCHPDSGHEERRECSVDVKKAEGGDLGAAKKAKRGALTAMFGLKTRHMEENDPRILGDRLAPEDVEELERRCAALGSDRYTKSLLKYLGAETFSDVYSSRLADARRSLTQAEAKVKANPSPQGGAAAPRNAPPSSEIPTSGGGAGPHQPSAPQNTGADAHGVTSAAQDFVRPEPSAPVETSPAQTGRVGPAAREEGSGAKAEVRESKPNESAPSSPGVGGGVGGGVLPQSSQIAPTSPPPPPAAPDAWEHWRTMSPADARGTWEAMSGDARASAWAKMPKDVRAIVRVKLETSK